ncbi:MAG TPA: tripartite tricarboxylate transporter TctB family protein [Thermodesulfobacteriota bacterium]|nr:tripartite tricarboxylate transporter TctB family protein [Thermodesulfobacteriota bacterium]
MKKFELIGSAFWLLVGVIICEESWRINLGQFRNPGPGFLPFGTGLILAGLALSVMARNFRAEEGKEKRFWADSKRWPKVFLTLACVFVYAVVLEKLGFLLTTFLVMGFMFRVIEPQRWRTVLAGAFLSAVVAYVVFCMWLQVELPAGFLGI